MKTIRCVVACQGGEGPSLFPCKVECTEKQYQNGDHYDTAEDAAREEGFDAPFVTFDEHDNAGKLLVPLFSWMKNNANTFKTE